MDLARIRASAQSFGRGVYYGCEALYAGTVTTAIAVPVTSASMAAIAILAPISLIEQSITKKESRVQKKVFQVVGNLNVETVVSRAQLKILKTTRMGTSLAKAKMHFREAYSPTKPKSLWGRITQWAPWRRGM